jgi:SAM-dependent MidA family methyltransferase
LLLFFKKEGLPSMRLDAFMAAANARYYATHDPFKDFVTAPEIFQAFGEVLGAWAAVGWAAMGHPAPVILAEAGPGRGTLMADACRLIGRVAPDFAAAAHLHCIETSPKLRAVQATRLPRATWHDSLDTVPLGPLILLANEFLDALPIRQFVRRPPGWTERWVVDGAPVERPVVPDAPLPPAADGEIVEIGEAALAWTTAVASRLVAHGGMALIIDYGPAESAPGDSLQAIQGGHPANPFAAPGAADLTAHVDFQAIATAACAAGAAVFGPIPQGPFLVRLGLFQRIDRLARGAPAAQAAALIAAGQRLVEPDRMGRLFKVLAICHPLLPVPAGFEE